MTITELEKQQWVGLSDYQISKLITVCEQEGIMGLNKAISATFKEVANTVNLPFEDFNSLCRCRNSYFFICFDNFCREYIWYGTEHLWQTMKLLKLPKITIESKKVSHILYEFSELNSYEKNIVREYFKNMQ